MNPRNIIALVDLDDTLFQSLRKCPEDVPFTQLKAMAFAADGQPLCYATPSQQSFLDWLSSTATVIPVTARGVEAFSRVRMPMAGAICANGGVLLEQSGNYSSPWLENTASITQRYRQVLENLVLTAKRLASEQGHSVRSWVVTEAGVPMYTVIKHNAEDAAYLSKLREQLRPMVTDDWTVHKNNNNVAFIPPGLGKAQAVERLLPDLRAANPGCAVLGVGDSLTDAPFMALCDFTVFPNNSQLSRALTEKLA